MGVETDWGRSDVRGMENGSEDGKDGGFEEEEDGDCAENKTMLDDASSISFGPTFSVVRNVIVLGNGCFISEIYFKSSKARSQLTHSPKERFYHP